MRKYIFLATGMLMMISAVYSQSVVTFPENFDWNTNTFTSSPASAWKVDTNYYISSPNGIRGTVPNMVGDTMTLTSTIYDFTNYSNVLLRFSHICKVSPQDIARVEYRTGMGGGVMSAWIVLPVTSYLGKANASQYAIYGFNANSYSEWRTGDSLAFPSQSWWNEELFDVSIEVGMSNAVQFRFVLQHGNTPGTQISYGWLIDNIEIIVTPDEIKLPVVEFVTPLVKDTVYSTGPWEINAKVKTTSNTLIENPLLKYIATFNGSLIANDSILMTMINGDSLWKANIPQFISGTEVVYSITGKDIVENTVSITSGYVIVKPNHDYGNISVALTSIVSPLREQNRGNAVTPVEVMLRNKGNNVLTSVTLYWSVNGVQQQPHSWTGNLLWDFEQQISLGTYQPRENGCDTVLVWVNMPNGTQDVDLADDTLSVITYGCVGNMFGTYTIGQGGIFSTMEEALTILGFCYPIGDVTLALKSGIYSENWELPNISRFMGNNTLTIISLANNADSVILRPPSGIGIRLSNTNHIRIEAITIDVATSGTSGIELTGSCSNVVVTHCNIYAKKDSYTYDSYNPIVRKDNTGVVSNISITYNILDGGYTGVSLGGGNTNVYGTNLLIDNNIISNQFRFGLDLYYVSFGNISNNTIISREINTTNSWSGIQVTFFNGNITGNHIAQRTTAIRETIGVYIAYLNYYNTTDTSIIANNEIILNVGGMGIYTGSANKVKILHNSIYNNSASGSTRGIVILHDGNNYMMIKNNNIVMESPQAHPIYLTSADGIYLYDMDYNNMYAPQYVELLGGALGNITSIGAWQQTVLTDKNSICVHPTFIDSTVHLKLLDYLSISAPILPEVSNDREDISRLGIVTAMGCYHGFEHYAVNGTLGSIDGFRRGSILGQTDTIKVQLFNTGTTHS
jgi:hypothetical protein